MKSVADLCAGIEAIVRPLEPFAVSLTESFGCVLAEDVVAAVAHPAFDNAATDGFAVRSIDLNDAADGTATTLPVLGEVTVGSWEAIGVSPGTALRIVAGARMPAGADAVLADEYTADGGATVTATKLSTEHGPTPGEQIHPAERDFAAGASVLRAGTRIGVNEMALLAAAGRGGVVVRPTPRAVVLSCGDELIEPGAPLTGGKVIDVNSYALTGAVRATGGVAFRLSIGPDDEDRLAALLDDNLVRGDLIVTTGGISGGENDVMQQALRRLGGVLFDRVAVDPGSTFGFGVIGPDATPIFCLPGNTDSALLGFELFVRPSLLAMAGIDDERTELTARLTEPVSGVAGARSYRPARLGWDGDIRTVTPLGAPGAGQVVTVAVGDGFIMLEEDRAAADAGDSVPVLLLGGVRQ